MPKPNYQFEKRQRELEKKKKKEEKAYRKAHAADEPAQTQDGDVAEAGDAQTQAQPSEPEASNQPA